MALGTAVKSSQALKLAIGTASTVGGTTVATFYQLPILSPPTIVDLTAQVDSSPQILGKYTLDSNQSIHNRTNQMFEISFSVLCSPTVLDLLCGFAFEDGDGANRIQGDYTPPAWLSGASVTSTSNIYIGGGGYTANTVATDEYADVYYNGCVCTSLEITHAIDSEGGKPVANATFVTGYTPNYGDNMSDAEWTPVNLTGDSATNFTDWHTDNTYLFSSGAGYEVHPYSYSVSLSRDIQRVGCADYTNYEPDGYVMAGGWDTSMNMVYKRDENFANIKTYLSSGQEIILRIGDGSADPFDIYVYGTVTESSVDTGNPELRNSITVSGRKDVEGTANMLNLEM